MLYEIETTAAFDSWLKKLRNRKAALAVFSRLDRAKLGNFGDAKPIGDGLCEMRIFVGPGYRLYYVIRECRIILLLCGGDKSTQERDIAKAKEMLHQFREDHDN